MHNLFYGKRRKTLVEDQKSETQKVGAANKGCLVKLAVTQSIRSLTLLGKLRANRQYIFRAIPLRCRRDGLFTHHPQQRCLSAVARNANLLAFLASSTESESRKGAQMSNNSFGQLEVT